MGWPWSKKPKRTAGTRIVKVHARYDAAQTTPDNRKHWEGAGPESADAAASATVRAILRRRARHEVANNGYASGIVQTLANDVIGTGPRLQMLLDDAEDNDAIETAFGAWAKRIDLAGKLRCMRVSKAVDGEAFALFFTNKALTGPVQLDLRLIEADQVTQPSMAPTTARSIDGVELDEFGNPEIYRVLKNHPGGSVPVSTYETVPVYARNMIHWFRADRPGQHRGVSEFAPTLGMYAKLRDFTDSVLSAAKTAADMAVLLKTNMLPEDTGAAEVEPLTELEFSANMATFLPEGWDAFQPKAEQPATTFPQFKGEVLNEMARPWSMPYNIAACNSSSYNYASGRLDHQTYYKAIRVEQAQCECFVLDRIIDAWMTEARAALGISIGEWPHQWFWDGHEHVDPAKEASAQETRLRNKTTNLSTEYARSGLDWQEQVRQGLIEEAYEIEVREELGLPARNAVPAAPSPAAPVAAPAEDADEEEADADD